MKPQDIKDNNRKRLEAKRNQLVGSSESVKSTQQLVASIASLTKELQSSGITDASKSMQAVGKELSHVTTAIRGANKQDISQLTSTINELISTLSGIEVKPQVNIPKTEVNVDLKPVISGLQTIQSSIKAIKFPEPASYEDVVNAVQSVNRAIGGLEFPVPNYVLPFKNPAGDATQVTLGGNGAVPTTQSDSASIDAFARARVSNPTTIFDSKQIFDNAPLFWDDSEVSGGSTTSTHNTDTASTVMAVGATTAGRRIRQTFMRFNYQPGKSQLVFLTGTLASSGGAGITRCMGQYDDDNGIFMQDDEGTVKAAIRSNVTGTPVDTKVAQADWNLDTFDGNGPSGITLDAAQSQIVVIDYEWLGVGRVRIGFVIDGIPYYVHQFIHANDTAGVYMSTLNLPLRYEIENDGTGAASELEHICASVISEGGQESNGALHVLDNDTTAIGVTTTEEVLLALRLKTTALGVTVDLERLNIVQSSSTTTRWSLHMNPTLSGTPSYSDHPNSHLQSAVGGGETLSSDGYIIATGYLIGTNQSKPNISNELKNAIRLGADIAGTRDELVLVAESFSGTSTLLSSISWRELS